MSTEGVIRVTRKAEAFGMARTLTIFVDGNKAGGVKNGASAEIRVTAGRHVVKVGMDWSRSQDLEIVVPEAGAVELRSEVNGNVFVGTVRVFVTPLNVYVLSLVPPRPY